MAGDVPPKTRFIIFSMARSGTSWLTTTLRSHPEILCHGEALLPRHFEKHVFGTAQEKLSAEYCENNPVDFIYDLFKLNDGHPIVGCKVFPGHSKKAHRTLMEDPTISKIVLKRENALASWSSLLIARKTGRWNTKRKGVKTDARAEFRPEEFEGFRERRDAFFNKLDKNLQGPTLKITYEEDIMGQKAEPVLRFLGASTEPETSSNKQKMLDRSIVDRFEDPDMIRDYLDKIGKPEWAYE